MPDRAGETSPPARPGVAGAGGRGTRARGTRARGRGAAADGPGASADAPARTPAWEAHQHLLRLLGPALALPVLAGVVTAAVALVPAGPASGWLRVALLVAGLAAVGVAVVGPVARWWAYRVRLTPGTVTVRQGYLRARERAVPLSRVAEVLAVQSAAGRVLGHGTLVVVPVTGPELRAEHVPRVRALQDLLLTRAEAAGAGSGPEEGDEGRDPDEDPGDPSA